MDAFNKIIDSFRSVEGAVVLTLIGIGIGVVLPLKYLAPKAKKIYLPIALTLLVAEVQIAIFLVEGISIVFFGGLAWQLLCLGYVLGQLRVCQQCGTIVGTQEGAKEVHICPQEPENQQTDSENLD